MAVIPADHSLCKKLITFPVWGSKAGWLGSLANLELKYWPSERGSKSWSCGLAAGFARLSSERSELDAH